MFLQNGGSLTAVEAKSYAQWISFGPFAFYAATVMRDTGLLEELSKSDHRGLDPTALASRTGLSEYGVSVLLDFGVHLGLVQKTDASFVLGKVGHFILHDEMTRINMNFTRDVCYRALPFLEESLRRQEPAGLQTLGPWRTIYEGLTEITEPAKSSWFRFDHFYSDRVFDALLPVVFDRPVRTLLDIGGNTGRWVLKCLRHDPQVRVILMDLPLQLDEARRNIHAAGFDERASYHAADLLDETQPFYRGADVIWMSQFLDCFSESEIRRILSRAAATMDADTLLYIVELFPDRQTFDVAAMSLDATSLYFTCIANGNSRMYHYSRFIGLVQDAGLRIEREIDDVGVGHTVLCCRRA
jgi:hypothetical protein